MTTANEVFTYIASQATEEEMTRFLQAMKTRRQMLVSFKSVRFVPGTRVQTTGQLSPQYLVGLEGTITQVKQTKAVVRFDTTINQGRFWGVNELNVPMSCLKEVE